MAATAINSRLKLNLKHASKGGRPTALEIRVLGYDVVAMKDVGQGYGYGGAPIGFVSKGRNLLFLRRTDMPNEFEVTVPIYQTAIHLADNRPNSAGDESRESERHILTQAICTHPPEKVKSAYLLIGKTSFDVRTYVVVDVVLVLRNRH